MNSKPIIGIVARSGIDQDFHSIGISEEYRLAIIKAGGIPIMILPTNFLKYDMNISRSAGMLVNAERDDLLKVLKLCDGFVLPGGNRWFDYDEVVCKYAMEFDRPLLGICLGMQIIGSMDNFKGNQSSDKTEKNNTVLEHSQPNCNYVHKVNLFPSKLFNILKKKEILVNSRHSYHILEKKWFDVSGYSEDGLVESIEIPNKKFIVGVQWHPESMIYYDKDMIKIFEEFVRSCHAD